MQRDIISPTSQPAVSRAWALRSAHIESEIKRFEGPNLQLLELARMPAEVRAVLLLKTPTLVRRPGQAPTLRGPVVVGFRYHEKWLSQAPIPWEVMTILEPVDIFLPSVSRGGGLCLGHLAANFSVESVLHLTWAAVVVNMRITNTIDWQVFRPDAAAFLRSHADKFPITRRGLMEPPEDAPRFPEESPR
jgi:hypothetical protein